MRSSMAAGVTLGVAAEYATGSCIAPLARARARAYYLRRDDHIRRCTRRLVGRMGVEEDARAARTQIDDRSEERVRMATNRREQIRLKPDEQAAFFSERKKAALATIDQDGFPHV